MCLACTPPCPLHPCASLAHVHHVYPPTHTHHTHHTYTHTHTHHTYTLPTHTPRHAQHTTRISHTHHTHITHHTHHTYTLPTHTPRHAQHTTRTSHTTHIPHHATIHIAHPHQYHTLYGMPAHIHNITLSPPMGHDCVTHTCIQHTHTSHTQHTTHTHTQISAEFRALKQKYQEVISDITCKMGNGMCVFLQDEVVTMAQWDEVRVGRCWGKRAGRWWSGEED